jgi:hypothetical protein
MSFHSTNVDLSLAQMPKLQDDKHKTCRSLIYDGIVEAACASIRGSPWKIEVHIALKQLCLAVDAAIDADEWLKGIFDQPRGDTGGKLALGDIGP